MANEVGRELKANELKLKTVVVLHKAGRPLVTMWVLRVGADYVMFGAGEINMTLIAKRNPDGTLEDDTPAQIHVYEYLGEV